jgi:alpha-D-ribose 1-methylphosphonate 5-triphosphate synthase subunit PhnL
MPTVTYSGADGQRVKDASGAHRPYTEVLLAHFQGQGIDQSNRQEVGDLFREVAYRFGQVHGSQQPEVLIQGVPPRRFSFLPPASCPVLPPVPF